MTGLAHPRRRIEGNGLETLVRLERTLQRLRPRGRPRVEHRTDPRIAVRDVGSKSIRIVAAERLFVALVRELHQIRERQYRVPGGTRNDVDREILVTERVGRRARQQIRKRKRARHRAARLQLDGLLDEDTPRQDGQPPLLAVGERAALRLRDVFQEALSVGNRHVELERPRLGRLQVKRLRTTAHRCRCTSFDVLERERHLAPLRRFGGIRDLHGKVEDIPLAGETRRVGLDHQRLLRDDLRILQMAARKVLVMRQNEELPARQSVGRRECKGHLSVRIRLQVRQEERGLLQIATDRDVGFGTRLDLLLGHGSLRRGRHARRHLQIGYRHGSRPHQHAGAPLRGTSQHRPAPKPISVGFESLEGRPFENRHVMGAGEMSAEVIHVDEIVLQRRCCDVSFAGIEINRIDQTGIVPPKRVQRLVVHERKNLGQGRVTRQFGCHAERPSLLRARFEAACQMLGLDGEVFVVPRHVHALALTIETVFAQEFRRDDDCAPMVVPYGDLDETERLGHVRLLVEKGLAVVRRANPARSRRIAARPEEANRLADRHVRLLDFEEVRNAQRRRPRRVEHTDVRKGPEALALRVLRGECEAIGASRQGERRGGAALRIRLEVDRLDTRALLPRLPVPRRLRISSLPSRCRRTRFVPRQRRAHDLRWRDERIDLQRSLRRHRHAVMRGDRNGRGDGRGRRQPRAGRPDIGLPGHHAHAEGPRRNPGLPRSIDDFRRQIEGEDGLAVKIGRGAGLGRERPLKSTRRVRRRLAGGDQFIVVISPRRAEPAPPGRIVRRPLHAPFDARLLHGQPRIGLRHARHPRG